MKRAYIPKDEDSVQITIVRGLRAALPHGWRVVSVANKPRSRVQGAREKRMGAVAGWPDLMVLGIVDDGTIVENPTVWFLEVKDPRGTVQPHQSDVHDSLKDLGFAVAVVRSWEDVVAFAKAQQWPWRLAA